MVVTIVTLLLASPFRPLPAESGAAVTLKSAPCPADAKQVAKLPFARGKSFCSLDAYLVHLRANGAIDLPWWREVRPGLYEHVKRMPEGKREVATRAELERRFGFVR